MKSLDVPGEVWVPGNVTKILNRHSNEKNLVCHVHLALGKSGVGGKAKLSVF